MAIFLNVPVRTGAPARLITIFYEGKEVRKEQLQISSRPDMWASIPLPDGEPDGYSFSLAGDGAEPLREKRCGGCCKPDSVLSANGGGNHLSMRPEPGIDSAASNGIIPYLVLLREGFTMRRRSR